MLLSSTFNQSKRLISPIKTFNQSKRLISHKHVTKSGYCEFITVFRYDWKKYDNSVKFILKQIQARFNILF